MPFYMVQQRYKQVATALHTPIQSMLAAVAFQRKLHSRSEHCFSTPTTIFLSLTVVPLLYMQISPKAKPLACGICHNSTSLTEF